MGGRSAETREGASCTSSHESHKSDTRQDLPFCRRLNEGEHHGALSTVRGFAGYEPCAAQVRDRTATVSFSLEDAAAMKTVEPEWSQRQHEDRQVTRH